MVRLDLSMPENRDKLRRAAETMIRLAQQRGSSTPCVQGSQDVIDDATIVIGALDVLGTQAKRIAELEAIVAEATERLATLSAAVSACPLIHGESATMDVELQNVMAKEWLCQAEAAKGGA